MTKAVAGQRIGILTLDTVHPLVLGNIQNANSFDFPVVYRIVRGVSFQSLMTGNEAAWPPILNGILELEKLGVDIVVGACGSFANYQLRATRASSIPVALSILLEVPYLLSLLPLDKKLCIVFASTSSFTQAVRDQCGIGDTSRIVTVGAEEIPQFQSILRQETELDSDGLQQGIVELIGGTIAAHPDIAAILLQCSDLPPYRAAIQRASGCMVFDMQLMIEHLHATLSK